MRLVLDTNEFIAALGLVKKPACEIVLNMILETFPRHSLYIPRLIITEVKRNLPPKLFVEFIKVIHPVSVIDEDIVVPFEIGTKYEKRGLKSADAFIAAYTEWVGADALVSENRHFLSRCNDLPFKVLNAESCIKFLGK